MSADVNTHIQFLYVGLLEILLKGLPILISSLTKRIQSMQIFISYLFLPVNLCFSLIEFQCLFVCVCVCVCVCSFEVADFATLYCFKNNIFTESEFSGHVFCSKKFGC